MTSRRFALIAAVLACSLVAGACARLKPVSTKEALARLSVATSKVYDSSGNLIASLHGEINRDITHLDDIPKHVQDAVVAIEDERFWVHQGLDLRSIVRAAVSNSRGAGASQLQGGSTISQQLAKNLYFPRPARTLGRKVAEARVTYALEREYTKREILERYLNTIYLGRGVYGIETAANSYFRKPASQLSLDEGAFLAGLIHEPGRYEWSGSDPAQRRQERKAAAKARRNFVLTRMQRVGSITQEEAEAAKREPLGVRSAAEQHWHHPYYVDLVLKQLGVLRNSRSQLLDPRFNFLGASFKQRGRNVYRRGLRIYTTLDPKAQRAAEQAAADVLPAGLDKLSVAIAAIEPGTGYIRAIVGGRDYYPKCPDKPANEQSPVCRLARVNLALGNYGGGSGRQPGSSFKPFVLTAALERGIPLSHAYSASPFTYNYPGGSWRVGNYEGEGGGSMTLLDGIIHSVNAIYAHTEIDGVGDGDGLAGAARVAGVARRMGVGFPTPEELQDRCKDEYLHSDRCLPADDTPAIALGAKEVSPLDMASALATFANDGERVEPTAIARITDSAGHVLYTAKPKHLRAIPSGVARTIAYALQQVVKKGTARRAAIDRPASAKTGTSQQWRDAWLDGFVPQLAAVVWVGNPIPIPGVGSESMVPANGYPYRVVGGTLPAMIWHEFMSNALVGVPVRESPLPPSTLLRPEFVAPELSPSPFATSSASPGFEGEATVPDVVGEDRIDARRQLRNAGFDVESDSGCDPSGNTGTREVFFQSPDGGTQAPLGSTVVIRYQSLGCD
jgi:penicillin-binding protein 1A